jgi:hypothetical protein
MSLLSNIEESFDKGNYTMDPFNQLGVLDVRIQQLFIGLINTFDEDLLIVETKQFVYDDWCHLLCEPSFILCPEDVRERILRVAWWVCNNLLCNNKFTNGSYPPKVDLGRFCKKGSISADLEAKLYINNVPVINSKDPTYRILLIISTGDTLTINFKNIDLIKHK